ncbi:hypothetical protein PHYBLDRAFT_166621 [Phycomyces blakesleeanus NRRL 1555(-)]|uniref:DDE Tnp4 domain-containing protein n=1 Tax=Phycomyces blakesleeanus (strain ATCC 8743b / DSM 1359 / FGSC 10004 / NBRC 33097 / NRRL 1555) TaxID=763407 RepID=A0A162UI29_PHYB8|nr:hypothetical protein PHYBLDRAFT_166621 [Phycomyces blakesleeanus NRRL 1555(-)]OAD75373.1 hypothetical protein PHYBLDRAFT_166621 [Phycomyces blakesleeanus NRRL 1555(-)]|eukprot:XP_018293413.1 hypothetical protein PHYBLDRAFT_166621 [Phycomyces blakesleeanus NRRL 1555(-)]
MQTVCCPTRDRDNQSVLYNSWKHIHALKFQAVVTPDGITSSLLGPFIGSCHDHFIYTISKIENRLKKYLAPTSDSEKYYALYDHNKFCNKSMSKVHIAVEWDFGEVQKYFKYCKYKYAMKTKENNLAKIYQLSSIFKNMYHCINHKKLSTGSYFNLLPPSLEDYISG